jgi:hypothetical protein
MRETLKFGLSASALMELMRGAYIGILHPDNDDLSFEVFCLNPAPYDSRSHTIELVKDAPSENFDPSPCIGPAHANIT